MSENLRDEVDEVADRSTWAIDDGVTVVAVARRRPGGIFTDVIRVLEERMSRSDFVSPLQAVVDLRSAAFSPTGPEIRVGALRLADLGDEGRIALLVANDFQFGLGRMLGILSEGTGFDIRPFRDGDSADRWVRER